MTAAPILPAPVVAITATTLGGHDDHGGMVMATIPSGATTTGRGGRHAHHGRCHDGNDVVARLATTSDPAFAAARALDLAGEAHAAAFQPWCEILAVLDPRGAHDWSDSAAVARAALGGASLGTARALAAYEARLAALDDELAAAEALFRATVPASEIGAAAMRAAARRYAARPGGWAGDAEALLGE